MIPGNTKVLYMMNAYMVKNLGRIEAPQNE
jgi:hypothetical protein